LGEKGLSRGQYRVAARGIVVNPHDEKGLSEALGMLIRDAKLSKLLGGSARDFVMKSYSHESMVSAYQDLYNSVCKTI
jgi:glycosyltransferase involved in cell wall biosynthesis